MFINLRELKREIISCLPKNNPNYQRSDILNYANQTAPTSPVRMNPNNRKSDILTQNHSITPMKIRSSQTSQSQILGGNSAESVQNPKGIKTYQYAVSLVSSPDPKPLVKHPNPFMHGDHSILYFHDYDEANIQNIKKNKSKHVVKEVQAKNVIQKKQIPKQQIEKTKHCSPFEQKQRDNESQIFNISDRKVAQQVKKGKPISSGLNEEFNPNNYAKKRRDIEQNLSEASPFHTHHVNNNEQIKVDEAAHEKRVQGIKKQNQNFSNVFGLEYGCKGSISQEKSEHRDISSQCRWYDVDSLRSSKDVGKQNRGSEKSPQPITNIATRFSSQEEIFMAERRRPRN